MRSLHLRLLFACLAMVLTASATFADEIEGLMGLTSANEGGWIAIYVPTEEDLAIRGMRWYNNDAAAVFPEILIGTGYEDGPGSITDALTVAVDVAGSRRCARSAAAQPSQAGRPCPRSCRASGSRFISRSGTAPAAGRR